MRRRLLWGLMVCPLLFVLLCTAVVLAAAIEQPRWWLLVPVFGSALPAVFMIRTVRTALFTPSSWILAGIMGGMCQFLLGGIMTLAAAANFVPALVAVTFVTQWVLIVSGAVLAYSASRVLTTPLSPELGYTPLTVSFRTRISGAGLVAGSASIADDRVEWYASSNKLMGSRSTGAESVPFQRIMGVREVTLPQGGPPHPYLRLWTGATVTAQPGPAVALAVDSGEVVLPLQEPGMFVELLNRRVTMWREAVWRR